MKKKMKPHVFAPGKYRGLPGPYCRHCHYSIAASNPRGCPNRYHWPRVKKITDTERLDFVRQRGVGNIDSKGFFWPSLNCTRFCGKTFRKAIDASIRAVSGGLK